MSLRRLREAKNGPRAFLRRGRQPGTAAVVVCAGDSLTHGVGSADYVGLLERRFGPRGCVVVNAGVSGDLAWNLRQRLGEVVACRPDVVTLLIGTNDVHATFDERWSVRYQRVQRLPRAPTLEWFRENVAAILDGLLGETTARLAVLTMPPIGEDLASAINDRVRAYNAVLEEVAAARGVACLPLYETLVAALPADRAPAPYDGRPAHMWRAWLERLVLRRPWNRISAGRGLSLLTDHVHLNETGAAIVAALAADFIDASGAVPRAGSIGR